MVFCFVYNIFMKQFGVWALLLLAFSPLLVFYTLNPTLDTKVLFYRGTAFLITLISALILLKNKDKEGDKLILRFQKLAQSPIFAAITASILLLFFSSFLAYDRYTAFLGEVLRGEGFLSLFALYILYCGMSLLFEERDWNRFFIFINISAILMFFHEVWQRLHGIVRPGSLAGNPIFLAAFYLFVVFAGCYVAAPKEKIKNHPFLGTIVILISLLGILLTETRGTFLGLAAATLALLVIGIIKGKEERMLGFSLRRVSIIAGILLFIFIGAFVLTGNAKIWQKIPGLSRLSDTTTLNSRLIHLKITISGFEQSSALRKTFGWGWDNYQYFWSKNYDPAIYIYDTGVADRAHNKPADMLIMTGILGFFVYVWIWFLAWRAGARLLCKNFWMGLGLICLEVAYFIHGLFAMDVPFITFMFYGILAWLSSKEI